MTLFPDCFGSYTITVVSDLAREFGNPGDVAMGAIQTSLAVLQEGSSLAAKLPFIAPIAGLILQALTMRDARVTRISSDISVF